MSLGAVMRVHRVRGDAAPIALLPDDAEVAELETGTVADEHVHGREIAMQQLAAVKLAEDVEDAGDLAAHGALGPALFLPMQVGAEITVRGVFEHQVVDDGRVPAHMRKGVEHANRARMVVEQLAEVRLAQPSVDPRADLETHRLRDDGDSPSRVARYTCPKPPSPISRSMR